MENCLETLQNGLEVKSNLISYVEPYSPLKGGASLNRGLWKVILTTSLLAIFILTYT